MKLDQLLLDTFDRIYIINLPNRADRRTEVTQQFADIGLTIDGERVRFFEATRLDEKGPFPSLGAHGCFMSHLHVLEDAVASGLGSILICEDDLDFAEGLTRRDLSWAPTLQAGGWDLFYGGYERLSDEVTQAVEQGLSVVPPQNGVQTAHCLGMKAPAIADCTTYLRAMLARPAGSPEGGPMHVDGAYSWFRKDHPQYTTVITVPAIGLQRASRSDIADLAWYDKIAVLRWITNRLRKAKRSLLA